MEDEKRPVPGSPKSLSASDMSGLGIQFAASIVVFLLLGQWLDQKLGTGQWLTLAGVFIGGGGAFYSMYRKITAAQRADDEARKRR